LYIVCGSKFQTSKSKLIVLPYLDGSLSHEQFSLIVPDGGHRDDKPDIRVVHACVRVSVERLAGVVQQVLDGHGEDGERRHLDHSGQVRHFRRQVQVLT